MRFGIVGNDEQLTQALDVAIQVAPTDLSVLITGESGVGKESFPKIIHAFSVRKHAQYIAVNCGAIPEGTIDSELFGHEKGAFTGAIGERKGYFGEANNGTIFLDEVGELPLSTQARLLRVLETGEFIKVGSSKVEKTNVRIVAATNVNLLDAINAGRFREDLYYRLNTVPIRIPALRERGNDMILLFRKFAADFAEKYRMPAIKLTGEAKEMLLEYPFPGNVRQLKNITEQISIIEQEREITPAILKKYLPQQPQNSLLPMLRGRVAPDNFQYETERDILYKILFDMRKEVNDLKQLVMSAVSSQTAPIRSGVPPQTAPIQMEIVPPDTGAGAYVEVEDVSEEHDIKPLPEVEKETILKTIEAKKGNRKKAAEALKISERTLYRRIDEYNKGEE